MKKLTFRFVPYTIELKHAFGIASNTRTTTPVALVEIEFDGVKGYGEASMPPYLGESHESVQQFFKLVNLSRFDNPFLLNDILAYVNSLAPGNTAAKAAIDIALHDLTGKLLGKPVHELWGYNPEKTLATSYTIGIDTPDVIRTKVKEASDFKLLKVKLGRDNDKEIISTIREITDTPICVDVNQGWTDKHAALDMVHWLHSRNVVFIEQPMPVSQLDDTAWLTGNSPLPIIADESVQRLTDINKIAGAFSGINIKLMKCTGMREAHKMAIHAKALGLQVMLGCMTETSCAISAAAQLLPLADWADLDGALLIKNDVFVGGVQVVDGELQLSRQNGIGVSEKPSFYPVTAAFSENR